MEQLAYTISQRVPLYYELQIDRSLIIINSFTKHAVHTIFFRKIDENDICVHTLFAKLKPLIERILSHMKTIYSSATLDILSLHDFRTNISYILHHNSTQVYSHSSDITATHLEKLLAGYKQSSTGFILTFYRESFPTT